MAQRRCIHTLSCRALAILASNPALHHPVKIPPSLSNSVESLLISRSSLKATGAETASYHSLRAHHHHRQFSSSSRDESENDEEGEETEGEYTESEGETETGLKREYSAEEKEEEAAAIGYKVVGPLQESERVIKPYEPVFAVVQVGSHQFKVSNGDCIFTERLKFCDVNDKVILNKVLLLGSCSQTIIGRPILPDAAVHALVEEHALDAKVIIFKKKRRKNYRRTKGHRQELTKLRITDIQGIEKPERKVNPKSKKDAVKKEEKVAVAA
ncbi:large ribosomal subunit protein bL21m [Euphorbia lathyris]|uniref:large ribosomal subunit protein bL21m n=1 Tax=Euphorbia lathyris TaxID=212925 RepID=UPI00331341C1